MRKLTKLLLVVTAVVTMLLACGQNKEEFTDESARSYVECYLKAILTGDVEDYSKLTGESKEVLEKQYEEILETFKETLNEYTVFGGESAEQYISSTKKVLSSTKYEVGQAKKDEDGNYHVEVKVYPSDVMNLFITKAVELIKGTGPDADWGLVIAEALDKAVDEQSFGDAVSYQMRVNKGADGLYALDENDVQPIVLGMFKEMNTLLENSKVFENPYLNWHKADWEGASEEEKTQCCLAMLQYMLGLTDEQMTVVNQNLGEVEVEIEEMKEGIDMGYSGNIDFSIGNYVELAMSMGSMDQLE